MNSFNENNPSKLKKCVLCQHDNNASGLLGIDVLCKCSKCGMVYSNVDWEEEIIKDLDGTWWHETYHYSNEREQEAINHIKLIKNFINDGKLLDYGAGGGAFVQVAIANGYEGYGIEIDEKASNYAKNKLNLNILPATIDSIPYEDEKFDIITLWNVLEHCPNPNKVVNKMKDLLKPGGYIFIEVPNNKSINRIAAILAHQFGIKKFTEQIYVKTAHIAGHVNHFDNKTLKEILTNNNFKVINILTTASPIELVSETFNKAYKIPLWSMKFLLTTLDILGKLTQTRSRVICIAQK